MLKYEVIFTKDDGAGDYWLDYFRHGEHHRINGPCEIWSYGRTMFSRYGQEQKIILNTKYDYYG